MNLANGFALDVGGKRVYVGDVVAFNPPYYKGLAIGTITSLTPKGVKLLRDGWCKPMTVLTGIALVSRNDEDA